MIRITTDAVLERNGTGMRFPKEAISLQKAGTRHRKRGKEVTYEADLFDGDHQLVAVLMAWEYPARVLCEVAMEPAPGWRLVKTPAITIVDEDDDWLR